jgi:hypothetical protein
MTTIQQHPSIITQQDGETPTAGLNPVEWLHSENVISIDSYAQTKDTLRTISGTNGILYRNATKQLWATGFNFNVTGEITGIELSIKTKRVARIQDYIIQLCFNGELIGKNQAILDRVAENLQTYGSDANTWDATLSAEVVNNETFGVVISFQSNDQYPHNDLVYMDQLTLTVYSG